MIDYLIGEYDVSLDEKNRLSIPARVREVMDMNKLHYGSGWYALLGVNRILCLYPEKAYQRIALAMAPGTVAPDELIAFERVNSAMAGKVGPDRQGRVLLERKLLERAGITGELVLIGNRDHLELWNRAEWEHYLETAFHTHEEGLLRARVQSYQREREQADL